MSRQIPLTRGQVAIVDEEDFEWLNQFKWYALKPNNTTWYAARRGRAHMVYMHRLILNASAGEITDHINRNGLDNRRANLRLCTKSQNAANSKLKRRHTSSFRGVSWDSARNKWYAKIANGKGGLRNLGRFKSEQQAAAAYNMAARERYGEFAPLNIIPSKEEDPG